MPGDTKLHAQPQRPAIVGTEGGGVKKTARFVGELVQRTSLDADYRPAGTLNQR
jgi:hypothetical protein